MFWSIGANAQYSKYLLDLLEFQVSLSLSQYTIILK